ncbi:MAG TPA: bifunctional (p)ppGpp synthetase/guanosine-3',5'-bis(diphosphate) 3'-pyrophosphohydrolase [Longimicrobium sp.]|nr:bifunctional (p)ppGpp synthetase/guanosine-3',5'-bis(diphosphate) 3'-pyrophosphohydrolase [Longimicrobium sp.]
MASHAPVLPVEEALDHARGILPPDLFEAVEAFAPRLDLELITRAYEFSSMAHAGQKRHSGEDYVVHCIEVAKILADLHLDSATIAGGLIHDVVEDTPATLGDVRDAFGDEVATVVDGLTKIAKVQFRTSTEQQVENFRKLLLSMAQDARVILIKLADRLHNMRTLEHLRDEKRQRIALETREIYAPLAHRLGVAAIRWELEDLCFKYLEPEAYRDLAGKIAEKRREREEMIENLRVPLEAELRASGIECEVAGRPKHLWSIYRKMVQREKSYEEIYDLMAVRVIVDTIADCYHALGVIHNRWTPLQERFHDYIATPKSNMYQSLHTTIFGPGGRLYEIQIRTREMHRTAEHGIAAHWKYKEGGRGDDVDDTLTWFRQVLEWQQETREPEEFMEFLRIDLFQDEIFVFTPMGDVKQLPKGATPIDFAFAVHTEVGLHCAGARVNGRFTPITRELKNGDTVEIVTDAKQRPSRDWLAFVKTARARNKIRQWIKDEEFGDSVGLGRDFIEREIRKARREKVTDERFAEVGKPLGYGDANQLFAALGRGDVAPSAVMRALWPELGQEQPKPPSAFERLVSRVRREPEAVKIQGMSNLMVRYSQCCQPVPGDKVIGYVTRGRGVSVHRIDCPNILQLGEHPERRVEIAWEGDAADRFLVRLVMEGTDRRGLLTDIASGISLTNTNIKSADIKADERGMRGEFVVEVENLAHLNRVINAIRKVKGVVSVERREQVDPAELADG